MAVTNTPTGTTSGPKAVRIRTNIGGITVPTNYAGGVSQEDIDKAIADLKDELAATYATQASLDDKLDRDSILTENEINELIK